MNKEQFRELVIPTTEKERLYRQDPSLSTEYYRSPESVTGMQDDIYVFPVPVISAESVGEHGRMSDRVDFHPAAVSGIGFNKQTRFSRVPLHRHDYIEMNYVYEGRCTAVINGQTVEMRTGDVCIMDCGVVHTILPTGEEDLVLNCLMDRHYFTASFVERFAASGPIPRFLSNVLSEERDHSRYLLFHTDKRPFFRDLMEEVFCEYLDPQLCAEGAITSYMNLVFIELVRCYQGEMESEYRQARRSYLTEILRYMDDNCTTCTLEQTADRFGFHPNALSRMIRQATGSSFKDLITDGRLAKAAFLLRSTAQPVQKIAQQCGYSNESFFYKKFVGRYGCTPSEYRAGN